MPAERLLGERQTAVDRHLEHPARRLHELDGRLGEPLPDLRRQTGGARFVVSNDAVLDRYAHPWLRCDLDRPHSTTALRVATARSLTGFRPSSNLGFSLEALRCAIPAPRATVPCGSAGLHTT